MNKVPATLMFGALIALSAPSVDAQVQSYTVSSSSPYYSPGRLAMNVPLFDSSRGICVGAQVTLDVTNTLDVDFSVSRMNVVKSRSFSYTHSDSYRASFGSTGITTTPATLFASGGSSIAAWRRDTGWGYGPRSTTSVTDLTQEQCTRLTGDGDILVSILNTKSDTNTWRWGGYSMRRETMSFGTVTVRYDYVAPKTVLQFGSQYVRGSDGLVSLGYSSEIQNPVAVAFVATRYDSDPVEVRIQGVSNGTVRLRLQTPDGQPHDGEVVHYMVAEWGRWRLGSGDDALIFEARRTPLLNLRRGGESVPSDSWISFSEPMSNSTVPVFHSLVSNRNRSFLTSGVHGVTSTGFNMFLEAAETGGDSDREIGGWIAFDLNGSSVALPESPLYAESHIAPGNDGVTDAPHRARWAEGDVTIFKMNTMNGLDGGWARGDRFGIGGDGVYAEEDTIGDAEQNHASERFALIAAPSHNLRYVGYPAQY